MKANILEGHLALFHLYGECLLPNRQVLTSMHLQFAWLELVYRMLLLCKIPMRRSFSACRRLMVVFHLVLQYELWLAPVQSAISAVTIHPKNLQV